jgi:hypothetical protein
MTSTPTLDRFNLHSFGGRCTCFSRPHQQCATCAAVRAHQERWAALTPEQRALADAEAESLRKPDGPGR